MSRFSIVLTGFEEMRSFVRSYDNIEDVMSGKAQDFKPAGKSVRLLVFNDGDLKIPCDSETFDRIVALWGRPTKKASLETSPTNPIKVKNRNRIMETPPEEELADVFGGDIPPIPEEVPEELQDGSGAKDDADDGVGQI